ncbi:MAG: hypothetical protein Q8Q26_13970 [Pseudorhodobacter sp.]|nr:hypothetical protein [Pseudorhodobacter sp.]
MTVGLARACRGDERDLHTAPHGLLTVRRFGQHDDAVDGAVYLTPGPGLSL